MISNSVVMIRENTSHWQMLPIQQPKKCYKLKFNNEMTIHQAEPEATQLDTEVAPRTQHLVQSRNQVQNLLLEYLLSQF